MRCVDYEYEYGNVTVKKWMTYLLFLDSRSPNLASDRQQVRPQFDGGLSLHLERLLALLLPHILTSLHLPSLPWTSHNPFSFFRKPRFYLVRTSSAHWSNSKSQIQHPDFPIYSSVYQTSHPCCHLWQLSLWTSTFHVVPMCKIIRRSFSAERLLYTLLSPCECVLP